MISHHVLSLSAIWRSYREAADRRDTGTRCVPGAARLWAAGIALSLGCVLGAQAPALAEGLKPIQFHLKHARPLAAISAVAKPASVAEASQATTSSGDPAKPAAAPGEAEKPMPPHFSDAMRVVLVKSGPADCKDDCKEWISAEGSIVGQKTINDFSQVLTAIGDRKVPVFINSGGGEVKAALAIGHMLREHHLDVAVTQTRFDGCAPTDGICNLDPAFKGYRGTALSKGAICASACSMVIAGGERRFISPESKLGVHQVANGVVEDRSEYKETQRDVSDSIVQIERELITPKFFFRVVERPGANAPIYRETLKVFFTEMGVSDKILPLMYNTDAAKMHWMTSAELTDTKLATDAEGGEALIGQKPDAVPATASVQKPAGQSPSTADAGLKDKPVTAAGRKDAAITGTIQSSALRTSIDTDVRQVNQITCRSVKWGLVSGSHC